MTEAYKLNPQIIYRKIGQQRILVPVGQQINDVRSIYTLNDTAAFILDALLAENEINQVIAKLKEEFEFSDPTEAQNAVNDIVAEFKGYGFFL